MSAAALTAVFLVGLLGGTHCIGMCGGIVSALTVQMPRDRPRWSLHLAYHAGRITTYAAAGALVGGLGAAALLFGEALPVQMVLYIVAQLMLVALGHSPSRCNGRCRLRCPCSSILSRPL